MPVGHKRLVLSDSGKGKGNKMREYFGYTIRNGPAAACTSAGHGERGGQFGTKGRGMPDTGYDRRLSGISERKGAQQFIPGELQQDTKRDL